MVSRSRRGARALSVLGWQGLVRGNLTQSKRTSTNSGPSRSWHASAGRPDWPDRVRPNRTGCLRSDRTACVRPGVRHSAYANYQEIQKKKSPVGWWIAGGALVIVIIVVAVLAIRAVTGGDTGTAGGPIGQPSQDVCPPENSASPDAPVSHPADGRVHGGPVSYPMLGAPWGPPGGEINPVPFGSDVQSQAVLDQQDYDGQGTQLDRLDPGR